MKVRSSHNGAVQPVGRPLGRRGGLHFLFQCAGDIVRAIEKAIVVDVAIDNQEFINKKTGKSVAFLPKAETTKGDITPAPSNNIKRL